MPTAVHGQKGFSDDLARVDDDASLLVRDDMKIVHCMVTSLLRLEIAARGPNAPCAHMDAQTLRWLIALLIGIELFVAGMTSHYML